jgi:hypothetical protein
MCEAYLTISRFIKYDDSRDIRPASQANVPTQLEVIDQHQFNWDLLIRNGGIINTFTINSIDI